MRTLTTLICVGFLMASSPPRALARPDRASRPAVQIDAAAIREGARTRVFVESPRGDETKLLELKQQLLSLGATRVNIFLPSILVCEVIEGTELGWIEDDPDLLCVRPADADAERGPPVSPSLALVMKSYAYAKKLLESGGEPVDRRAELQEATTTAGEFTDLVLEAPREIVDLSARLQDDGAPGHAAFAERDLRQNSEFLIGNVMIQLVLPESMGTEEDWTDQDLAEAIAGAYAGALAYQQRFGYAPINFVVKAQRRVPCDYEPILSNLETDETWISDVMLELGYRDTDTYLLAVHRYNNAGRKAYGTDWVFTAFIACSRNQEKHTFRGANYVAYAWGGGPHLVIPFPAASYPQYDYTEREIFSMIFQHEMGHIFWALDEYPSSPSECGWRAGYLDYPNRNKFSVDFDGVPHGCPDVDDLEFCVMMNAIQAARPVCYYTTGQIGLADANGNSVPDVFDAPPVIEFEGSDSETLQTDEITVNMRALATIVPNKNPNQTPETRISYGAPLMDATARVSGTGAIILKPLDGKWNEMEEDLSFAFTGLRPGLTRLQVRARNTMGATSEYFEKKIYRIGVDFVRLEAAVRPREILVKWTTAAETFGATFDLYRIDTRNGSPDTSLIASNVPPSDESNEVFVVFQYGDADISPGREYRYFVRGQGAVEVNGRLIAFEEQSNAMISKAMLPIAPGTSLSMLSPNPFSSAVSLSLDVPKSYAAPAGDDASSSYRREVRTPIEILVYDALGRKVREVYRGKMYSQVATFEWDGKNSQGEPVPSGVYFIRASAGNVTEVRKAVVVR